MQASQAQPLPTELNHDAVSQGIDQGMQPDQALALIGLGLTRRLLGPGVDPAWIWSQEEGQNAGQLSTKFNLLRQRLELTQLAIDTGAPLNTAEVAQLIGARPIGAVMERGGLRARRLCRNVWQLSRCADDGSRASGGAGRSFQESVRRRL